jgi:hypothetical protein
MLLGFKPRFVDPILLGTKVFTLRNKRKNQPKIGETLFMYTGLRTSNTRKISDKEKLMSTQEVLIYIARSSTKEISISITVDNKLLTREQVDQFVKYDGFVDRADFADYWIASSHKPKKAPVECTVGGNLDLFHWTDLRY